MGTQNKAKAKKAKRAPIAVADRAKRFEACVTNDRWNGGKWIRNEKRHAIYARDGHKCAYCGRHEVELNETEGLQLDHVIARSKGGGNHESNLVTVCSTCNAAKGEQTLVAFARKLARSLNRSHNAILRRVVRLTAKPIDRKLGAELFALRRSGAAF